MPHGRFAGAFRKNVDNRVEGLAMIPNRF